jgi:hypothetical protein
MLGRQTKAKRRASAGYTPPEQLYLINRAIADLEHARDKLRKAGSKHAADYVARALKSAWGARNHQQRLVAERSS